MEQKVIYDAEQHIDIDYIETILKDNIGKEIICFGGGTAAEILMRKVLHKYDVSCFLDNNTELQGTTIFEKKICSPDILLKKEKGSYIILILSKHVEAISKQLKSMDIREEDCFNIYDRFIPYFLIKRYEQYAYNFVDFIERIPDGTFDNIPLKDSGEIGIVCLGEMMKNLTWYSMAQSLLLRYNGYRATLIIDTLKSFCSYIYFDGIEKIARYYIDFVLDKLTQKCKDIKVLYIDESNKMNLDEEDLKATKKYSSYVVKWLDSRHDDSLMPGKNERFDFAESILKNVLGHIKFFFDKHQFETINVHTGIHRHRCMYTYIGEKIGMRVSTYDGSEEGRILYETIGIPGHSYDIEKLVNKSPFTQEEEKKIIELSKEHFEQRRKSLVGDEGRNYQIVSAAEVINPYDIIIPLNIAWDSAALVRDDIFISEKEWLEETLEFIINKTDCTVMIREHPAKNTLKEFLFPNYENDIPIISRYPDRIYFASASAKINTYQYIEACKVVLPYTSTVGVEAALLGKNVVLHTNVYYQDLGVAYKAVDKQDYYHKILECLSAKEQITCNNLHNSYLAYYYQMNHVVYMQFNECLIEWMKLKLEELNELDGVDKIIGIIARDESAIFRNVKEKLVK